MRVLCDTNIFLHALDARMDAQKTADCYKIFELSEKIGVSLLFNTIVVFEFFFHLKMFYGLPPKEIHATIGNFFAHRNVVETRDFHCTSAIPFMKTFSLEYPDAMIAQNALEGDFPLLSYDKDFDRVKELVRLEPKDLIKKYSS